MVILMKLHLQLTKSAVAGVSTSIICMLKLLMGFRFFKDEALYQSRLFLFRLSQIAFNRQPQISNLARMERALRLIFPRHDVVTTSINSTSSQSDHELQNEQEEMFYSLSNSMLAL
jgi:protein arginine N-methyltransferase 7